MPVYHHRRGVVGAARLLEKIRALSLKAQMRRLTGRVGTRGTQLERAVLVEDLLHSLIRDIPAVARRARRAYDCSLYFNAVLGVLTIVLYI